MKKLSILLIGILTNLSVQAQQGKSTVSIIVSGNNDLQLSIDGRDYNLTNSSISGNKSTITISNLEKGQHTLQVTRTEEQSNRTERISAEFNLRTRFNMTIKLNSNGSLELIETIKTGLYDATGQMSDDDFNNLLGTVRIQPSTNKRRSEISKAFSNTTNYFTTSQVEQLLQLINDENYRLQLAKLSYSRITDPVNFSQLYYLFRNQASKDDLDEFVNTINGGTSGKVAMTDIDFSNLYQAIRQQRPVSAQVNSLTNEFNNINNYFTTAQASQLIRIINAETNRLQLAKLSLRRITDPENIGTLYNLFRSQASKDELAAFINNYSSSGDPKAAMADDLFNDLYLSLQLQFMPGERMSSLTREFTTGQNFFTCTQAKKLIQLVTLESNRLQLAKLSYRIIVNRNDFGQLYDLLNSEASRNELAAYVNTYKE